MKSRLIRTIIASGTIVATIGLALTGATPASASGKGTIAFLLSGPDLYYQYGLKGAEAAATKLGYTRQGVPQPQHQPLGRAGQRQGRHRRRCGGHRRLFRGPFH